MATKYLSLLCVFCALLVMAPECQAQQEFNVDQYLYNRAWMRSNLDCLLDKGFCDDTGNMMKGMASWLLTTRCKDCSPVMKQATDKSIAFMQKYYRREWRDLKAKYAP